jgi:nucleotide-binding universal stress UspA family protein
MKILLPVDGSACCDAAVAFVAARPPIEGRRPQIDLLNVQPALPPLAGRAVDPDYARARHEANARKVLKPAIVTLQEAGLDPAWFHRVGLAGPLIAQWAEEHDTDLIVMGSHGRTSLKNLLFGSVTQTVLASTQVPLLVVRSPKSPRRSALRVGIAIDGSVDSLRAARWVVEHLGFFGRRPRFTLLHVVEPSVEGARAEVTEHPGANDEDATARVCEQILAPVRERFAVAQREVACECLSGRPGVEIAAFARRAGLDLLVLGSHGHGALTSALLGSVAWRVAAGCDTPLLLLRSPH